MQSLSLRTIALSLLTLITSSVTYAATPVLVYNYGNQVQASSLAVSSDGTVVRIERLHGTLQTINENPLSGLELKNLKSLVTKAIKGKITQTTINASLGSQAGTIATYSGAQKKDLEGVVRIPTEMSKATKLSNNSPAIKSLKAFVNKYVVVKMK